MHNPRDDIDRLYVSRKEVGRELASTEDSVVVSIRRIENIKKNKERLITTTRNSTDNIKINGTTITSKQKWGEKQLYGYFKRQTDEISQRRRGHV